MHNGESVGFGRCWVATTHRTIATRSLGMRKDFRVGLGNTERNRGAGKLWLHGRPHRR